MLELFARTASNALVVVENTELQGDLTVDGTTTFGGNATISGNTTFTGDLSVAGNITGSIGFTDNVIDVGVDSANTTAAIGIAAHKGTGNRFAYFAWSKTNNKWTAYYSDEAGGGTIYNSRYRW